MEAKIAVKGMHCPSCEALVVDTLEEAGVHSAEASHKKGLVTVKFYENKISLEKIKGLIKEEGYEVIEGLSN